MERYFRTLANYNHEANIAMLAIIADLPEEQRTREVGSFYHSIEGVVTHIYNSDYVWLRRIRAAFPNFASLDTALLERELTGFGVSQFADFAALRTGRTALDGLFVQFAAELNEGALQKVLSYSNLRGVAKRYVLWEALIHVFNHQTHHRGQVAEILDELGVKNDYSNVVGYLAEPPRS